MYVCMHISCMCTYVCTVVACVYMYIEVYVCTFVSPQVVVEAVPVGVEHCSNVYLAPLNPNHLEKVVRQHNLAMGGPYC